MGEDYTDFRSLSRSYLSYERTRSSTTPLSCLGRCDLRSGVVFSTIIPRESLLGTARPGYRYGFAIQSISR
jgi:hypothetical protein